MFAELFVRFETESTFTNILITMSKPTTKAISDAQTITQLKATLEALKKRVDALEKEISVLRIRELLDELPFDVDDEYGTLEELWKKTQGPRRNKEFFRLVKREEVRRHKGWATARPDGIHLRRQYQARQSLWEHGITASARVRIMEEESRIRALFSVLPVIDDPAEFWGDGFYSLSAVRRRLLAL